MPSMFLVFILDLSILGPWVANFLDASLGSLHHKAEERMGHWWAGSNPPLLEQLLWGHRCFSVCTLLEKTWSEEKILIYDYNIDVNNNHWLKHMDSQGIHHEVTLPLHHSIASFHVMHHPIDTLRAWSMSWTRQIRDVCKRAARSSEPSWAKRSWQEPWKLEMIESTAKGRRETWNKNMLIYWYWYCMIFFCIHHCDFPVQLQSCMILRLHKGFDKGLWVCRGHAAPSCPFWSISRNAINRDTERNSNAGLRKQAGPEWMHCV